MEGHRWVDTETPSHSAKENGPIPFSLPDGLVSPQSLFMKNCNNLECSRYRAMWKEKKTHNFLH